MRLANTTLTEELKMYYDFIRPLGNLNMAVVGNGIQIIGCKPIKYLAINLFKQLYFILFISKW